MIKTNRGNCYITYVGDKACGKIEHNKYITYPSSYNAFTMKYFLENYKEYISEINEYGAKNKDMIQYINKDPDLICSLIDVGKTRWLVGDGAAYIDTECLISNTTSLKCSYILRTSGTKIMYGVSDETPNATNAYGVLKIYTSPNRYGYGYTSGSTIDNSEGSKLNTEYELYQNMNVLYIDGKKVLTMPNTVWKTKKSLWLYARNSTSPYISDNKKKYFIIMDNDKIIKHFVPYKNPNGSDYGMLDIIGKKFYGNVNTSGAFTIEFVD